MARIWHPNTRSLPGSRMRQQNTKRRAVEAMSDGWYSKYGGKRLYIYIDQRGLVGIQSSRNIHVPARATWQGGVLSKYEQLSWSLDGLACRCIQMHNPGHPDVMFPGQAELHSFGLYSNGMIECRFDEKCWIGLIGEPDVILPGRADVGSARCAVPDSLGGGK